MKVDKTILEKADFNPYYMRVDSHLDKKIMIHDKKVISFGSNDYLGLAADNRLKDAAKKAIDSFGISLCGTPIVVGYSEVNQQLEKELASFLHKDDALCFPSGYQANLGAFKFLAGKDDIVLIDDLAHSSLVQGARLSRAKVLRFAHNDMDELKRLLELSKNYSKRFIAVDGLYSTEGDTAPLDEITELAKTHDAFTIVDDAHGLGILGNEGKGTCNGFDVDMVTGSLGKAVGCSGGFIAAKKDVAEYFRYFCPPYVYSTALPPAIAASAIESIDIIRGADDRRSRLFRNKTTLYKGLEDEGYELTGSKTPLFSIKADAGKIIELARDLFDKGIYATPFVPPSVPEGRLRLIPHARLDRDDLEQAIDCFKSLR